MKGKDGQKIRRINIIPKIKSGFQECVDNDVVIFTGNPRGIALVMEVLPPYSRSFVYDSMQVFTKTLATNKLRFHMEMTISQVDKLNRRAKIVCSGQSLDGLPVLAPA